MAKNECNPCSDNVFTRLSSNPDIADLISGATKLVIVDSGDEFIKVATLETEDDITYTITYNPYTPLVIESFVNNLPLQIEGATVTDYILDWVYSTSVETHGLDNGLVLTAPVENQLIYQLIVGGQSVTSNTTITLTADDIIADANAAKVATTSILFGNFLYSGSVSIADTNLYDPTEINIKGLTPTLAVNAKGANPITYVNSGVNNYHVFAAPTDSPFVVNNFQDSVNPVAGGFVFVKTLDITNSEGHLANYTVWRTSYDNSAGTDGSGDPITFSII